MAHDLIAEHGDDAPITWLPRERRYGEKLATPDTTISDLIGEVDPIKVAEGRYLSDELTLHYGLIPRTNRGIFCLNELPGPLRADPGRPPQHHGGSATCRSAATRSSCRSTSTSSRRPTRRITPIAAGIITPLKDRYGLADSDPLPQDDRAGDRDHRSGVVASFDTADYRVTVPRFMKEIVAEVTHLAPAQRRHQPALRRQCPPLDRQLRKSWWRTPSSAPSGSTRKRRRHGSAISRPWAPRRWARSSWSRRAMGREDKVVDKLIQHAVVNTFAQILQRRRLRRGGPHLREWAQDGGVAADPLDGLRDGRLAERGDEGPLWSIWRRRGTRRSSPPVSNSSSKGCTSTASLNKERSASSGTLPALTEGRGRVERRDAEKKERAETKREIGRERETVGAGRKHFYPSNLSLVPLCALLL